MKDRFPPQKQGNILFTGCPRSGTRSVAQYYRERGLKIGHEQSGPDGTVEWRHAYGVHGENYLFPIEITIVRDPYKTIVSLAELLEHAKRDSITWDWILKLAKQGGWSDDLHGNRFLSYQDAAIEWWTSVYHFRLDKPFIKIEDFLDLPNINHHIPGSPAILVRNNEYWTKFISTAQRYGYDM